MKKWTLPEILSVMRKLPEGLGFKKPATEEILQIANDAESVVALFTKATERLLSPKEFRALTIQLVRLYEGMGFKEVKTSSNTPIWLMLLINAEDFADSANAILTQTAATMILNDYLMSDLRLGLVGICLQHDPHAE